MSFSRRGESDVRLDRLEVEGLGTDGEHSFDSDTTPDNQNYGKNIDRELCGSMLGTLLLFLRAGGDSRSDEFIKTAYNTLNRSKGRDFYPWVKDIIGVDTPKSPSMKSRALAWYHYKYSDLGRNRGERRYWLIEQQRAFEVRVSLDGRPADTAGERAAVDAALLRRFVTWHRPRRGPLGVASEPAVRSAESGPKSCLFPADPAHRYFRHHAELERAALQFEQGNFLYLHGVAGDSKTSLSHQLTQRWLGQPDNEESSMVSVRPSHTLEEIFDLLITSLPALHLRKKSPDQKADGLRTILAATPRLFVLDDFDQSRDRPRIADFLGTLHGRSKALATGSENLSLPLVLYIRPMQLDEARDLFDSLAKDYDLRPFMRAARERVLKKYGPRPGMIWHCVSAMRRGTQPEEVLSDGFCDGLHEKQWVRYDATLRAVLLTLACFPFGAKYEALSAASGLDAAALGQALVELQGYVDYKDSSYGQRFVLSGSFTAFVRGLTGRDFAKQLETIRQRQVAHYVMITSAIGQCWDKPKNMEPLDEADEQETINRVIAYCREKEQWAEVAAIARGMRYYAYTRGQWIGSDSILKIWIQAAIRLQDEGQEFEARTFRFNILCKQRNLPKAEEALARLKVLLEKHPDLPKKLRVQFLHAQALHRLAQGEYEQAERLWEEGLALNGTPRHERDEHDHSAMVRWRGVCLRDHGKIAEARASFEKHYEHAVEHRLVRPALISRLELEGIRLHEDNAAAVAERVAALAADVDDLKDQRIRADHRLLLGHCLARTGNADAARVAFAEARETYHRLGQRQSSEAAAKELAGLDSAAGGHAPFK